jgi:hypothetical protein
MVQQSPVNASGSARNLRARGCLGDEQFGSCIMIFSLRDGVGMCCLRDHTHLRAKAYAIQQIGCLLLSHPHLTMDMTVALTAPLFL